MMKLLIIVVLLVVSYPAYEDYQGGGNPAQPSLLKLCHSPLTVNLQFLVLAR
ncbi:type I toxin-antitoxin system Ibs family toxin [Escherichia albertii]|nr:type I toxin-antitoxin system Ibs family toxin [Escherichia albertii]